MAILAILAILAKYSLKNLRVRPFDNRCSAELRGVDPGAHCN
jgi:hypothetical protein